MNKQNTDQNQSKVLKLISEGKRVVIAATNGTETLASATDIFTYISPDFKNWGCDKDEEATPEVAVEVYEQITDATYPNIFGSIDQNLDSLILTTSQIRSFIMNNAKDYYLEGEEWTCFRFLFKVGNEFFVADVRVLADGNRDVRVTRFLDGSVRHAQYRHRIVVPN
jgi:hypothetical protein